MGDKAWCDGVMACLQLNLLDELQAALLIALHHRLHVALRQASEACAGFAWLVGPMVVEEIDVMFEVTITVQ